MPFKVSLGMPLNVFFLRMPAAIPCFLHPFSHTCNIIKGFFLGMPAAIPSFLCPLSLTWDIRKGLFCLGMSAAIPCFCMPFKSYLGYP